jgi:ribosomal-protein-alanine N-acetyltransferase
VAIGLYRSFGFEITGRRLRYYRDNNEDALIMTLDPISKGLQRTQGGKG